MRKNVVRFSFVMPSYKIKYMRKAIDSILNQSYTNFELIIVNDASPDNLLELVRTYKDDRISYYENDSNMGGKDLVYNWNQCVRYAKGEFLILASDDDLYMTDFLKRISDLIEKYPNCNLLKSRVQRINSKDEITSVDYLYPEYMNQAEFIYYWAKGFIKCISNYVFRRDYFINNGQFVNFPLAWFSDDATVIRMSRCGIVCTKDVLFQFRSSDINISMKNDISTLKIKLVAIDLFYKWIIDFLRSNNLLNDNYMNPTFNIHKYLFDMILKIISEIKNRDIFFVINYLFNNRILYKKEKVYVMLNFLF